MTPWYVQMVVLNVEGSSFPMTYFQQKERECLVPSDFTKKNPKKHTKSKNPPEIQQKLKEEKCAVKKWGEKKLFSAKKMQKPLQRNLKIEGAGGPVQQTNAHCRVI